MKSVAICIVLGLLGALPGAILAFSAQDASYLGIALIGGLIGLSLGAAPLLYRTTIVDALRRVGKGFAKTIVDCNLGELLGLVGVKTEGLVDGEPEAAELTRDAPSAPAQRERAIRRASVGGKAAGGAGAIVALGHGVFSWEVLSDKQNSVERGFVLFFCVCLATVVAGVYGSAVGMLTVPGRHRLRIVGAAGFGLLLGVGFRLAVGIPRSDPFWGTVLCVLAPVTVCTAVGLFTQETV